MRADVGRERGHGRAGQPDRAIRVTACATATDHTEPTLQPVEQVAVES